MVRNTVSTQAAVLSELKSIKFPNHSPHLQILLLMVSKMFHNVKNRFHGSKPKIRKWLNMWLLEWSEYNRPSECDTYPSFYSTEFLLFLSKKQTVDYRGITDILKLFTDIYGPSYLIRSDGRIIWPEFLHLLEFIEQRKIFFRSNIFPKRANSKIYLFVSRKGVRMGRIPKSVKEKGLVDESSFSSGVSISDEEDTGDRSSSDEDLLSLRRLEEFDEKLIHPTIPVDLTAEEIVFVEKIQEEIFRISSRHNQRTKQLIDQMNSMIHCGVAFTSDWRKEKCSVFFNLDFRIF